ncbi:batten's disease protein Cln3 [Dipodascopsis tothii]|uniref:batten's disease protein Cln3 n=1 Tax=Dipodascopsis tothii TaxID=44089 RepID=UPI0034CD6EF7
MAAAGPEPASVPGKERTRLFAAFWIFGLINNVLYVIILSAALDLVGPTVPKATVLLADVMPSFVLKVVAPFFVHLIPYRVRIFILVALSLVGMEMIVFTESIGARLFGVALASASSGLGELTFLALTHFYPPVTMLAFSSGTGGAGLVGSFCYLMLTTWLRLSVRLTLFLSGLLPLTFFGAYFWLLPPPDAGLAAQSGTFGAAPYAPLADEEVSLADADTTAASAASAATAVPASWDDALASAKRTLGRLQPLVVPYMLPLALVYIGEYIINQGISPTLLFPLDEMPFGEYRDAYVTYGTLYQLGVFISRSSSSFVRVRRLYVPAVLQLLNVIILTAQSMFVILPNVYFVMALIFYEGLLGGLAYINTFLLVSEQTPVEEREFAMGAVGVSDSGGIVVAATINLMLEGWLCGYQQAAGRPYCTMT